MSILFYKRPDYTSSTPGSIASTECSQFVERASKGRERTIPPGLSFENVINNKALPPCSLNDFMDYLVYVELSAENLQFYLWYKDYVQRWELLSDEQKRLSPEWQQVPILNKETNPGMPTRKESKRDSGGLSRMISRVTKENSWAQLFDDGTEARGGNDTQFLTFDSRNTALNSAPLADAGLKWEAFTIQPFRDECHRIMRHYLAFSAPRELNLSHRDRAACLHALQHTTHPSAFAPAMLVAAAMLQAQSHPNFIRWSICNGNKPRVLAVRAISTFSILAGFTVAIFLTLSTLSIWWRLLAIIGWLPGIAGLVAAYKGLCIIMYVGNHSRNLRPWEQYPDVEASQGGFDNAISFPLKLVSAATETKRSSYNSTLPPSPDFTKTKFQNPFGPGNKEWEDSDWVGKYKKKNFLAKIFDKEVWIQDEHLRMLQDRIVIGANFWALVTTIILCIIFISIPAGNYF